MMDEPFLNFACLSAFKLSKIGAITLFLVFFAQQGLPGGGFLPPGTSLWFWFRWPLSSSRWATTFFLVFLVFVKLNFLVH